MIRKIILTGAGLFFLYVLLLLVQIWGAVFSDALFIKISLTFLLIIGLGVLAVCILYHLREEEEQRDDKFLN